MAYLGGFKRLNEDSDKESGPNGVTETRPKESRKMPWVLILLSVVILLLAALSDDGAGGALFAIVLVGLYFLPFGLVVALAMPVNNPPKQDLVVTKIPMSVERPPASVAERTCPDCAEDIKAASVGLQSLWSGPAANGEDKLGVEGDWTLSRAVPPPPDCVFLPGLRAHRQMRQLR